MDKFLPKLVTLLEVYYIVQTYMDLLLLLLGTFVDFKVSGKNCGGGEVLTVTYIEINATLQFGNESKRYNDVVRICFKSALFVI